jgi:hypothetical protein
MNLFGNAKATATARIALHHRAALPIDRMDFPFSTALSKAFILLTSSKKLNKLKTVPRIRPKKTVLYAVKP